MKLVAFFSLDVRELPDGRVGLPRKFLDGMAALARGWGGRIDVVLAARAGDDTNLDHEVHRPCALPFRLVIKDGRDTRIDENIRGAALVLVGVDYRHVNVARTCRRLSVPYVVVAEYALRTRLQIAAAEEARPDKRIRRMLWEVLQEVTQRQVIASASGLQCNGTPAFDAWAGINRDPLLYFDTRVERDIVAGDDCAQRRGRGKVLQLAYSGRLVLMKGVLHLIDVAALLRARGLPFVLHVWGSGPMEEQHQRRLVELHLRDHVRLEGTVPFRELMVRVSSSIDLFLCPHVQGDPSCTYLETLACAVPIAGFANDAWIGVLGRSQAGWAVPLGDAGALAEAIVRLDQQRSEIAERALCALRFARAHTFEDVFVRRMEHLRRIACDHRRSRSLD